MRVGYPDTMNRQEASPLKKMDLNDVLGGKDLAGPLKARYTTSGDKEEIKSVDLSGLVKAVDAAAGEGDSDNTTETT